MSITDLLSPLNITLAILVVSAILFMSGKIRSDLVALCTLLSLVLTGVITPTDALSGFSNPVVLMMVGLFIVGGGIFRTGLAKLVSSRILRLAGKNEILLFVLVMLVTAFVGAFVSNTGTVALMIPIVVSIAVSANINPRRLLMPLAFASSMGILTLIATPPNLIVSEELEKNGFEPLSFFSFTPVGLIGLSVGIIVLFFLSKIFLSGSEKREDAKRKEKSLDDLVEEYQLNSLKHIQVPSGSMLIDKALKELSIPANYNISVVTVKKIIWNGRFNKQENNIVAGPDTIVEEGDVLICYGKKNNVKKFIEDNDLTLIPSEVEEESKIFDFQNVGLAEGIIMPNSRYVNRTVVDTRFRAEFNVNILGIQRNDEYIMTDLQKEKLHAGDALLLQGTWEDIANLDNRQEDLVLLGQPLEQAAKVTLDHKAPVAAIIMLGMIIAMVTNIVAPVIAVLSAAVLIVLTGCLRNMEEAYKNINWESVVLIAGMMPMAVAFEKTGAAELISNVLVGSLGEYGPYALLAGVYFGTSLLTMFVSNTATALLFAPIGMQAAVSMGVSPLPFMFAVTVAASMCFASPFSTAPNALVMAAGKYTFMDFIKVGLPLQIIMGIVMILVLPLLFPFS